MAFTLDSKPDLDVPGMSESLEQKPLKDVLSWCWEMFGDRAAIGTSFQGSGLVIIDHARKAGLDFPIFTIDTGLLFPETTALKKRLEDLWTVDIESITPEQTLEEQAETMGSELWKTRPDTCCQMRKVLPLQSKLATLDVWITGVRRGQSEHRKNTGILELYEFDKLRSHYLLKLNPMVNWSRERVWQYLGEENIPYNELHDRGYRSIGCWPCTRPVNEGQDERAGRWEGFEKTECGIHTFLGQGI
ncbi:MAG: phosphoadenylyl-sulfate reductase [Verrucomicrobiales bacterium]|jgi:phosphoadenosine phosphosulfate reductase|nr:phosphoadenylyl-sulfate reductase [Verrucomicrobiales bacterium]MED5586236.1 phosphoadenylyl-sulfate reductase [Verrucomicrobiota bacterium]